MTKIMTPLIAALVVLSVGCREMPSPTAASDLLTASPATSADVPILRVPTPAIPAISDSAAGLWAEPMAIIACESPRRVSGTSLFRVVEDILAMQERERVGVLYFTLESRGTSHIDGKVHRSGFPATRAIFVQAFLLPKLLTFNSPSAFRSALEQAFLFGSIVRMTGDATMTFTTPATSLHLYSFGGRIYPAYVQRK